jgi:UDP-GlcNAc:undecaprenyl-phosphate GlcNAc-1-phosphate transferase
MMNALFLPLIAGFLSAVVFTRLVREFTRRRGYLDTPDADRKLHRQPTPLGGGLAVFGAITIAVSAALAYSSFRHDGLIESPQSILWLWISGLLILVVGFVDDVIQLRGRQKLAGQVIAVLALIILSGLRIRDVQLMYWRIDLGLLAIPATAFWLLAAINSINLLDGADGFATAVGLVIAATMTFIAGFLGRWEEAIVSCALTGALLGFLTYNFPPSSIFLGDAGSMLIGLIVGALAIEGNTKSATSVVLAAPVALLAIPILDTSAAVIRRSLTGRGLAIGDRAHLHHAMMRKGFGPRRLVVSAALFTGITCSGALATIVTGDQLYAWCAVGVVFSSLVLSRLFGHNELMLITSRVKAFASSMIPTVSRDARPAWQNRLGLRRSPHCSELWNTLTTFSDEHRLAKVRLDLNGTWMDDGRDVLWERITPQPTIENWRTCIPLFARGRNFGQIEITATVNGYSGHQLLRSLSDLIDSLDPCIERLINDSARRGLTGFGELENHVLFINRSYWPDCEATGQLLTDLCEDLGKSFHISVLAGQPNENPQNESFQPSGVQRRNGVEIHRVRHTRFSKRTLPGKALNLTTFLIAATWRSFFIPKHHVVVVETDPFLLALLGWALKRLRGSKLIIYVQDVYPDVAVEIGKVREGLVTRSVRWLLLRAYHSADRLVVLGHDMRRRLIDHGIPANRFVCIPNWVDTTKVYPIKIENDFRRQHAIDDKFVVMHSGNMGLTQRLELLLEAADRLKSRDDILFLLLGDGAIRNRLREVAQSRRLTNVRFLPYQHRENLALSLSAADLHVVSMHERIAGCLVPSKIYGALASGTPVLAIVPAGTDVHDLVERESIGFTVSPGDVEQIARTISDCANGQYELVKMGALARQVAESNFDRRHSVQLFENLLDLYLERQMAVEWEMDSNVSGARVTGQFIRPVHGGNV